MSPFRPLVQKPWSYSNILPPPSWLRRDKFAFAEAGAGRGRIDYDTRTRTMAVVALSLEVIVFETSLVRIDLCDSSELRLARGVIH
jgi:hypothetical protein